MPQVTHRGTTLQPVARRIVRIPAEEVWLDGDLAVPERARGIVLFAHGSGSSRLSPRNRFVAERLQREGFATLLFDLLTSAEEREDILTAELRFNIGFLAQRLLVATEWTKDQPETENFPLCYFGASTGAAAALKAAGTRTYDIAAIVSRGGRVDLAGDSLAEVRAPTLMIVGELDPEVIELNRMAADQMLVPHALEIVPGATHLFEEPGKLDEVASLAASWFAAHTGTPR